MEDMKRTCPETPVGTTMRHVKVHRAGPISILQDGAQRCGQIIRTRVCHLFPKVRDPPSAATEIATTNLNGKTSISPH